MMKKIFALVLTLILTCSMLVSCGSAQTIINKADYALQEAPYAVTMKMDFECDNQEMNQIFSAMNMEFPMTVDGEDIAMDMSMNVGGQTTEAKVIVADRVMYYDIEVMGQSVKMKAAMNEKQYAEFMKENNTEMMLSPEEFGELTLESKDGKKYITCSEIGEEGIEELNDLLEEPLESMKAKVAVRDVSFTITVSDGKYESMDMTCVYEVTFSNETYEVTMKLNAEFSYDNIKEIQVPTDADEYQEMDFSDLMG